MTTNDIATLGAAAVMWIAFAYKFRHLRRTPEEASAPALRALTTVMGIFAAGFVFHSNLVTRIVDHAVGLSGVSRLTANMLSMCGCLAMMAWIMFLSRPAHEARARMVLHTRILVGALITAAVMFAFDHPPVTSERLFAGSYTYLVFANLAWTCGALIVMSWRGASRVDAPLLSLGLRLVAIACVVGELFLAVTATYLVADQLHFTMPGSEAVTFPIAGVAAVLLSTGVTVPSWGPRLGLERLWWRLTRWQASRRLEALWTVVTDSCPGVVLDRELLSLAPGGERLIAERIPVEIHDAWLNLRFYLTQPDLDLIDQLAAQQRLTAKPCHPERLAAVRLLVAIARKESLGDNPPVTEKAVVSALGSRTCDTLLGEVRFLRRVARHIDTPFARQVLASLPPADQLRPTEPDPAAA